MGILAEWRECFKAKHNGREPRLWINKYCIDQQDIAASLACLPVCLAGCSKLVILCGETYLSRLWCVLEIYVFLEMGGSLANLEVYLLGDGNGKGDLRNTILQFDARDAKSSSDEETLRLQQVLAIAGYEQINLLVQSVFQEKLPPFDV